MQRVIHQTTPKFRPYNVDLFLTVSAYIISDLPSQPQLSLMHALQTMVLILTSDMKAAKYNWIVSLTGQKFD